MIAVNALSELDNQPGGFSITTRKNWLIGPIVGWNNILHTTAIATNDVTYGKKKLSENLTPLIF